MAHETDYQRARRQRLEVRQHGVTGSTPEEARKRIASHLKSKALAKKTKEALKSMGAHVRGKMRKDWADSPKDITY